MNKVAMLVLMSSCSWSMAEPASTNTTPALPPEVLMQIDDWRIPTDWFQHEFRSTFFRHAGATNVRDAVFTPFRNRMVLHAKAREDGIDQDEELLSAIEQRIAAKRAFMEYQLEMVRIDMINEVLVRRLGITTTSETVTDEELAAYFETTIKPRPGAPSTMEEVPPHIMESLRAQTAQSLMEYKLEVLMHDWETNMTISVNREAIQSVPMPVMEGQVPAGFRPR